MRPGSRCQRADPRHDSRTSHRHTPYRHLPWAGRPTAPRPPRCRQPPGRMRGRRRRRPHRVRARGQRDPALPQPGRALLRPHRAAPWITSGSRPKTPADRGAADSQAVARTVSTWSKRSPVRTAGAPRPPPAAAASSGRASTWPRRANEPAWRQRLRHGHDEERADERALSGL